MAIILATYRDFEDRVNIFDTKLSALDQVLNAIDKKIGKFTKSEIMELAPAISKSSVEKSLKELLEKDIIDRHGVGKATYYTKK